MLNYDADRLARIGMPEAILCDSKSDGQLEAIVAELAGRAEPVLLTRLDQRKVAALPADAQDRLEYDPASSTAFLNGCLPCRPGSVAIVGAGTSDLRVCAEAARTLRFSGIRSTLHIDVGVAGLWRLLERLDDIRAADVVIVAAGMDGALVSVLGGLVAAPVIAVPTSVGYGAARAGETALHSALASCAQGVAVVNIDNGFGAACVAVRMLSVVGAARSGVTTT